jgi:hypothetical protein
MSEPLKEYKRIKKHKKDELYLSDLLIVKWTIYTITKTLNATQK